MIIRKKIVFPVEYSSLHKFSSATNSDAYPPRYGGFLRCTEWKRISFYQIGSSLYQLFCAAFHVPFSPPVLVVPTNNEPHVFFSVQFLSVSLLIGHLSVLSLVTMPLVIRLELTWLWFIVQQSHSMRSTYSSDANYFALQLKAVCIKTNQFQPRLDRPGYRAYDGYSIFVA